MNGNANKMEARRAELLADVAAHTADLLSDYGLPQGVAEQVGCAIADALAERWGGQLITFPKDHFYKLSQREVEIYDAHRRGASYPSLARQYNMAERSVRRLIRRAETRRRDLRQIHLF